ncbi:MAG: glycosyltransferase [Opitutaceae bacterium]
MELSVIIPAHNPDAGRLRRTLQGLQAQTLPADRWETVIVDNASTPAIVAVGLTDISPPNLRIVAETQLGLTWARQRGFLEAQGKILVLVDDDNVLAADYLEQVLALFATHPRVGALGGKSLPEFPGPAPTWTEEFHGLLALRDLGDQPLLSSGLRQAGTMHNHYPLFAPIGAGMGLRREAAKTWVNELADDPRRTLLDRCGGKLVSGGDNDIVLTLMNAGWEVAYFPQLALTHLIPEERLTAAYLERLNRAIHKSWMQVLTLHDANPWPPLSATGAALRKLKAWFTYRAWSRPAGCIRWQGACGHFDGRVRHS